MQANRPLLRSERFTQASAWSALGDLSTRVELGCPRLLAIGRNAVFTSGDKVIKLYPDAPTDLEYLSAQLSLARFLCAGGLPVASPISDAPICGPGYKAVIWRRLSGSPGASPGQAAKLLRRFHSLSDGFPGQLPDFDYPSKMDYRFQAVLDSGALSDSDLSLLSGFLSETRLAFKAAPRVLGAGVIHGDLHQDNLITTRDGAYLIDFDWVSFAERENDLFKISDYRFSGSLDRRERFFEFYGIDPSLYSRIAVLEELTLFSSLALLVELRPRECADKIERRLIYYRSGRDPSAPTWSKL